MLHEQTMRATQRRRDRPTTMSLARPNVRTLPIPMVLEQRTRTVPTTSFRRHIIRGMLQPAGLSRGWAGMFETLFHYPRVLARHVSGPLAEERRSYLDHRSEERRVGKEWRSRW